MNSCVVRASTVEREFQDSKELFKQQRAVDLCSLKKVSSLMGMFHH